MVCKGIGKKLFENKSDAQKALEKRMVQEWVATLDEVDDGDDVDDEEGRAPWYAGNADAELDDDDFILWRTWKEYKEYLAGIPNKPLRGPPKWDLTKWTQAEKAPFLLDNQDDGGLVLTIALVGWAFVLGHLTLVIIGVQGIGPFPFGMLIFLGIFYECHHRI